MSSQKQIDAFWAAVIAACAFALTACGNQGMSAQAKPDSNSINGFYIDGGNVSSSSDTASNDNSSVVLPPPLHFQVTGVGNHAQHICVPAKKKLILRMTPHANVIPLGAASQYPRYADNTPVYDGSPAYYSKLRVRMSIQNTAAAWDYVANVESHSAPGDYSSYLHAFPALSFTADAPLPTPEYQNVWILGSSPNDGLCTYWEQQLGKCAQVSSQFRYSELAGCNSGEQKVLISKIVSDYPCNMGDKANWCKGNGTQIVPDYQNWSITVEAATENTKDLQ